MPHNRAGGNHLPRHRENWLVACKLSPQPPINRPGSRSATPAPWCRTCTTSSQRARGFSAARAGSLPVPSSAAPTRFSPLHTSSRCVCHTELHSYRKGNEAAFFVWADSSLVPTFHNFFPCQAAGGKSSDGKGSALVRKSFLCECDSISLSRVSVSDQLSEVSFCCFASAGAQACHNG